MNHDIIKQFPDYLQNEVYKELHKLYDSSARVVRRLAVGWEGVGGPAGGGPARLVGTTPHRRTAAP